MGNDTIFIRLMYTLHQNPKNDKPIFQFGMSRFKSGSAVYEAASIPMCYLATLMCNITLIEIHAAPVRETLD